MKSRNENGRFAKGNAGGGRPKGSTNKATTELREFISTLIDENREKIISDLEELDPKERIKTVLEMMRFVLPTLKSVESTINGTVQTVTPFMSEQDEKDYSEYLVKKYNFKKKI